MANGLICKHCGYQQTAHEAGAEDGDPQKLLEKCPKFTLSKKDAEEQARIDRESVKRIADRSVNNVWN